MNDLISRSALLEALDKLYMAALRKTGSSVETIYELDHLAMLVKDAPAVDAEAVRHGVWLTDLYNMKTYETYTVPFESWKHSDAYCSVCKQSALCNGHEEDVDSRYCPNCGAKMDAEVEG